MERNREILSLCRIGFHKQFLPVRLETETEKAFRHRTIVSPPPEVVRQSGDQIHSPTFQDGKTDGSSGQSTNPGDSRKV